MTTALTEMNDTDELRSLELDMDVDVREKYLFIDFDGVVNALSRDACLEAWGNISKTRLQGFPIHYAPELVQDIERMSSDGVNVVWLTTWCEDSAAFTRFGFNVHPYLGVRNRIAYGVPWWKWEELQKFLETKSGDVLIGWCDDDLMQYVRYDRTLQDFLNQPNVMGLTPFSRTGMTPEHIDMLRVHFGLEVL